MSATTHPEEAFRPAERIGGIGVSETLRITAEAGALTRETEMQSVLRLYETIPAILAKADAENRSSAEVADDMARARIAAGRA